jgi:hypothetical protein
MQYFIFCLVFIPFFFVRSLFAQELQNCNKDLNIADPELINGRLYTYFPPRQVDGNQYFTSPEFSPGTLTIRGKVYNDLLLNYDVYNQAVLLKYTRQTGAPQILEVSEAWLSGFSFQGKNFYYMAAAESPGRILQVIGDGSLKVFYKWEKRLEFKTVAGKATYIFNLPPKKMYLYQNDRFISFQNNRSFIRALDPLWQDQVKKYLKSNKLKVRKLSDEKMDDLISYCNSLL